VLLAMAIARPAMPAMMRSQGIAQMQPQKQQRSLRMTPMPLTMPSVRRSCGSKEERSRQVCGDLCLCMAKEVAAAVSVHSGISKGQAQNQNSVLITQEDAKSTSPAGDGAISTESTVTITVVGASGDLAKKKIFPALFALYYEGCLPKHFTVFGYARSKMTDEELRNMISATLTCRIDQR
jgi:hypothetical protein